MTLGPLMVDIGGLELTVEDREVLAHPLVGGVILFARNFDNVAQLRGLTASVQAIKSPPLLIAVDYEGGRVQRFREGFTRLPAMRLIGECYAHDAPRAAKLAETAGWLAAAELGAAGMDFSFAPVVDLDTGVSEVIGARASSADPDTVATLGRHWMAGAWRAGQISVAKHFPGHGSVAPDSHTELVVDPRDYDAIAAADLVPFRHLFGANIAAVMLAHIVYPTLDEAPASLSKRWIKEQLRGKFGYTGAVFCDDLSMHAVAALGDVADIAARALTAGCDMLPLCNNRPGVERLLTRAPPPVERASEARLKRLYGRPQVNCDGLQSSEGWREAHGIIAEFMDEMDAVRE